MENASFFNNSVKGGLLFTSKTIDLSIPLSLQFEVADPFSDFNDYDEDDSTFNPFINFLENELAKVTIYDSWVAFSDLF
jgi:hypothetical protein